MEQTIEIVCKDCGTVFELTPGEQTFYADHNFETPKRCKLCRQARKAASQQA